MIVLIVLLLSLPTLASAADYTIRWTERPEADVAGYHIYIDDRPPIRVAKPPYTIALSTGPHNIAVSALDTGGREGNKSVVVSVDAPPPEPVKPFAFDPPALAFTLEQGTQLTKTILISKDGADRHTWDPRGGNPWIWTTPGYGSQNSITTAPAELKVQIRGELLTTGSHTGNLFVWQRVDNQSTLYTIPISVTVVAPTPPPPPPPPPPPAYSDHDALTKAINACVADTRRTLLKCFKLLQAELRKVTPQ